MTTVYIVECGEYSGRFIAAAYDNQDWADAYARANDGCVLEIEIEETLEEEAKRYLRPGERYYWVGMNRDGNDAQAWPQWNEKKATAPETFGVQKGGRRIVTGCWASSEEHAIKIVNDRRSRWLAVGGPEGTIEGKHPAWADLAAMP